MGKKYSMDMSGEKEKKELIPEGWRRFQIYACVEHTSKAGNAGFKFSVLDNDLGQDEEVYAIGVEGKRWFLKSILAACNIAAAQDKVYDWDIKDVLDKIIMVRIEHYDDPWVNREGKQVTTRKWRIKEVRAPETEEEAKKREIPF